MGSALDTRCCLGGGGGQTVETTLSKDDTEGSIVVVKEGERALGFVTPEAGLDTNGNLDSKEGQKLQNEKQEEKRQPDAEQKCSSQLVQMGTVFLDPSEFQVHIKKQKGKTFGVDVAHQGEQILVEAVSDGLFKDWNDQNPRFAVQAGDELVEVNGKRGKALEILTVFLKSQQLDMVFRRAPEN
mmetsp:Transcript_60059/g.105102  ORF Transcript_60059/g.105102 Transcript_60059/m.105102 type:complete len:184 (-) Transcript_60059:74-625(-)